jgi:hypothetical protein
MISLSSVDRTFAHVGLVNTLIDMFVNRFLPKTLVAADCLPGYSFIKDVFIDWECWLNSSCGLNQGHCVKHYTRYWCYYFGGGEPTCLCPEERKTCNSRHCIGTAECSGSG